LAVSIAFFKARPGAQNPFAVAIAGGVPVLRVQSYNLFRHAPNFLTTNFCQKCLILRKTLIISDLKINDF